MKFINKLLRRDVEGATAIEYGLIAALIAVAAIAAMQGKHVYQVVEEMLSIYKAATVETLPAPKGSKKVKLIKAARVHS